MLKKTRAVFLGLALLFLFPSVAPCQAVFLVRKALGLISRITDRAHHHETASVLLEADASKVFAATEKIIREKPENRILSKDDRAMTISFTHDGRAVTLRVVRMQDDLAQILVVSSGDGTPKDDDYVVNGILRVCDEMGAHCWTPKD